MEGLPAARNVQESSRKVSRLNGKLTKVDERTPIHTESSQKISYKEILCKFMESFLASLKFDRN